MYFELVSIGLNWTVKEHLKYTLSGLFLMSDSSKSTYTLPFRYQILQKGQSYTYYLDR